jgi:ABC-type transport system involved in multi-copper enzyme maturation permease subunit
LLVCTTLVTLYLAITASIAVSRERDRRTLEVLLYGPVDEASFLLGIFFAQIWVYLIALLMVFVWANLVTWLLHLAFSTTVIVMLLASTVMAAAIIAFGLFTAVWGGRTRTALVYFFLVILLLAGLQIGDQVITSIVAAAGESTSNSLLLIRNALATLSQAAQWVSPYSQFSQATEAVASGAVRPFLAHLGLLVVQAGVLLLTSILILQRKGARQ